MIDYDYYKYMPIQPALQRDRAWKTRGNDGCRPAPGAIFRNLRGILEGARERLSFRGRNVSQAKHHARRLTMPKCPEEQAKVR